MCGVWRGYDVAGVGRGEFALQLVSRQRVAPLCWRSDTHTHTPWFTTHRLEKFNRPNANLMYEQASNPPSTLGILTSADFFWKQSQSPTHRTFYGHSYTAPTPSIHTLQQLGLAVSKGFSSLLTNATRTFLKPPTAPQFDLYSFLACLEDTYPVDT
jgi:hypothetical protein